jgi:uncharacterized protein YukE
MKTLLAFLPPLLVAVGDAVPAGFDWGTISATGLLGWYLWYTTKVIFPSHQKQVSGMQETFSSDFKNQRDHYEKILNDIQDRYDKKHDNDMQEMQRIIETLDKINNALSKIGVNNERSN